MDAARVARFVAHVCDWGALATISTLPEVRGRPFVDVLSLSDGPPGKGSGVPYMYLSPMQVLVSDLQESAYATLTLSLAQTDFCRKHGFDPQSPLCAHIMLSGTVTKVGEAETDFAKQSLFIRHPEMKTWPSSHQWFIAKLNITNIWVLDYFGGPKIVTPAEYYNVTVQWALLLARAGAAPHQRGCLDQSCLRPGRRLSPAQGLQVTPHCVSTPSVGDAEALLRGEGRDSARREGSYQCHLVPVKVGNGMHMRADEAKNHDFWVTTLRKVAPAMHRGPCRRAARDESAAQL
ncbi:Protein CREG1 [Tupaia chinensis]|uniref:Protein CREG1 n=2 Tax=Tupaia chinensis TaxID=246437 RepID=L9L1G9_TUPCH|nr:Protein CREG1 [Tupaia chinensis]